VISAVSADRARVTIVGLGPGSTDHVTEQTRQAIAAIPHRILRTSRHPSASLVTDAPGETTTCDDLYDTADDFDAVYANVVERVVEMATRHRQVLYAVPGSPLILERTVRLLADDPRLECHILPAMSFLDVAYARLGIDPIESSLTLIDGHRFATAAAGRRGPLLIAHTHANWVLSEIKLSLDDDQVGETPVIILQGLGTNDERIIETTWAEMDHVIEADHLTSVYVPSIGIDPASDYTRLHQLTRTLREQCPWDQKQTHASLIPFLLEETYEVVDALSALDSDDEQTDEALIEELGDLLFQVEFHATIAEQAGRFTIADVTRGIHDKLVRRHPHVFGDVQADDAATVLTNWDAIKRAEKSRTSVFDGVANSQPALMYAWAVQRKAAKVGFDWADVDGAFPKIGEETAELHQAMSATHHDHTAGELGDLLFAVVNVARHLGIEPETALRNATHKFRRRFEGVERLASQRGIDIHDATLAQLDGLWDEIKATE